MASEPSDERSAATSQRSDGLFDDNVDLNPPFAPRELDAALRTVKVRGRRRRLLTVGPLALFMGSGLALIALTIDFGGNAQVTQIGSDLGSSAALEPETGSGPQGSSVLGDGSSVGDSYSSGPSQMTITPVPTQPAISLDDGGLAADQPPIEFDLTEILAPLAVTPEASSGVTITAGSESDSQPTSTPTPPVSASAHTSTDDDESDDASSEAESNEADAAADDNDAADDGDSTVSVATTAAEPAADESGSEPTSDSTTTDDPDVSASGTSASSSTAPSDDEDPQSGADPSTATTSTADDDSQTDLETEESSAVDDLASDETADGPDSDDGADADSDTGTDGDEAAGDSSADPATDASDDGTADDGTAGGETTDDDASATAEAEATNDDADPSDEDDEGDGELVIIDANGDIITPDAEPTPVPQPVVLSAAAQVSGFEIIIDIGVIDGDGYSIGACGTTVNWGDGMAQDSACDPSCTAVDSSAPAAGVDGQLQFSHVYEVRNVQVTPFITVFTGLECYGDSSTVTFGPLLITDTGIAQS